TSLTKVLLMLVFSVLFIASCAIVYHRLLCILKKPDSGKYMDLFFATLKIGLKFVAHYRKVVRFL
ncbi:MAG: hypothetical protein K2J57_02745, partial [Bacteroidales bacterium]|nr:hypothetical protein [Bacteroidales bacterium]